MGEYMANGEYQEMRPLTEVGVRRHKQPTQEGWDTAPNILRGESKPLHPITEIDCYVLTGYDDAQSDEVAACTS